MSQKVRHVAPKAALAGLFALGVASGAQGAVVQESGLSVLGQKYALEKDANTRVELNAEWASEVSEETGLPGQEFKIYSFFETGAAGDKSFDINTAVVRLPTPSAGHLWFGRGHPVLEDIGNEARLELTTTSAVGANWVQNQSNALEPRVVGWIGTGWSGKVGSFSLNFALSPIFLPTFGPRLEYSETADAEGSRFARLPPAYLKVGDALMPMRYRIDTGDITDIILQNQFFVSFGPDTSVGFLRAFAWSAPAANPEAGASGMLKFNEAQLDGLAVAVPRFPRRTYFGLHWALPGPRPFAAFEGVYERSLGQLTLSAQIQPWRFVKAGALHTVDLRQQPASGEPAIPSASPYSRNLFWAEVGGRLLSDRVEPSLRAEEHMTSGKAGLWLKSSVHVYPAAGLSVFGTVSLLAGDDESYFGQWRSLDSISTGVRYQW